MNISRIMILSMLCMQLHASRFCTNFGIDFNYARYSLGSIAQQSGYLAGPHFDFSYKKPRRVYTGVNFDGRWNAGLVSSRNDEICGTSCISGGCLQAKVADYLTDWELGYYYVSNCERFSVKPYSGVGFQHLSYLIDPTIMRYKYYQVYVPIGLEFLYHSVRNFAVGFELQYRAGAYNHLRVSTPCVEDDCNSPCGDSIKLNYSQGVNVQVPFVLNYRVEERVGFHLSLTPFFDWNTFADTCDTNSECLVFPISKLNRWYLGMNLNLGITF